MEINHLCTIKRQHSGTYLPPLPPQPSAFTRFQRKFRTWILVSRRHPKCIEYFKSATGIRRERKKHVRSKHPHIIHPFSSFRLFYEMYMVVLYLAIIICRCCDFTTEPTVSSSHIVYEVTALLCIPDIFVTFSTGYEQKELREVILEPRKIAMRYIKSMLLFIDIMSYAPVKFFFWMFDDDHVKVVRVVVNMARMLLIVRLHTVHIYVSNIAEYFGVKTNKIFIIIRYMLTFVLIAHFSNIVLFHIPQIREVMVNGYVARESWLRLAGMLNRHSSRYFETFFLSSSLLFGTGIAGLDPRVWEETAITILLFIVGRFYGIVLIVLILHMMMTSRMLEIKYDQKLDQLEEYMTHKDLPAAMRKKLRLYYDYKYQKRYFREQMISSILSDGLKREIKMHVCRRLISNVTLFAGLSAHAVSDIIEYLRKEIYLPNDSIITAGEAGDCMYFLSTGTVAVYTPSGRELCHLQDGAYFGEISLIMKDQFRTASVYAVEICEVYILERKHFKRYFMGNASLYQQLYQKAEDRLEMLMTVEEYYKNKGYGRD